MKTHHVRFSLIIFLLCLVSFGCKSDKVSESEKAEFKKQISTEMNTLDTQINNLRSRVASLNQTAKEEATLLLEDLQKKQREVHKKIEMVQNAPGSHWDEVRVETKELVSDLQASYDQARKRFP